MKAKKFIVEKIGNDEEYLKQIFEKYPPLAFIDLKFMPKSITLMVLDLIDNYKKNALERLKNYFISKAEIGVYSEIVYEGTINIEKFNNETIEDGMLMMRIKGNLLCGIRY